MNRSFKNKNQIKPIKMLKGIYRRTLLFNSDLMLCHFILKKNSEIPIHSHKEHQVGYIIKGKIHFFTEDGEFIAQEGDSYIFQSNEKHGAKILEEAEIIDVFNPSREDYK
jgi:quercetin dioxygenase-like cupin family protein